MKSKRFQYKYRANASKLHKLVGNYLRQTYPGFDWYQEYPVKYINSSWSDYRAKYDWCCPSLRVIVEAHGAQHTKKVQWHGRIVADENTKSKSLEEIQAQDQLKKEAAEEAGYLYAVVHYNEKPEDVLPDRLSRPHPKKTLPLEEKQESSYDINRKKKAKEYRHKQYLRNKEWQRELSILREAQLSQDE